MQSPSRAPHVSRRSPSPRIHVTRWPVQSRRRASSSRAAPRLAAIAVVNDLQSFEREVVPDLIDVFAVGREKLRQAASRDNLFQRREVALSPREKFVGGCGGVGGKT